MNKDFELGSAQSLYGMPKQAEILKSSAAQADPIQVFHIPDSQAALYYNLRNSAVETRGDFGDSQAYPKIPHDGLNRW